MPNGVTRETSQHRVINWPQVDSELLLQPTYQKIDPNKSDPRVQNYFFICHLPSTYLDQVQIIVTLPEFRFQHLISQSWFMVQTSCGQGFQGIWITWFILWYLFVQTARHIAPQIQRLPCFSTLPGFVFTTKISKCSKKLRQGLLVCFIVAN